MNKIQRILTIVLLLVSISFTYANHKPDSIDHKLQQKLSALFENFKGVTGVYVYHLVNGSEVAINADTIFPTASMIKVPIMLTLFDKIEAGKLSYGEKLVYKDSLFYSGEDILGSFKDGAEITLNKLVMLMITMSDNTASLWCQQMAG